MAPPGVLEPQRAWPELFEAVQSARVFGDSKTFVDAAPLAKPADIGKAWEEESGRAGFDLRAFVEAHFALPQPAAAGLATDPSRPVREHVDRLWDALTRRDEAGGGVSSLIALPRPYVVPGGRFREIYYWDSYFTMLGLAASGRAELVADMVANFAFLIDTVGFVPNGNRGYFCSRSQPPYFALMVSLLAGLADDGDGVYRRYRPQLEAEYRFWMDGDGGRAVDVGGLVLNRYWDDDPAPRPESWLEDRRLAERARRDAGELYREIRAACESGWDFSSRWLERADEFASIRTTEVLPVDLNCLLYDLERALATAASADGDDEAAARYERAAGIRAAAVRERFFDERAGLFVDLLLPGTARSGVLSLASLYPLFCGIAAEAQAAAVADAVEEGFLETGGWLTTLTVSGQQWDAPSGWAPLQWIAFRGLKRYGFDAAAEEGARRWVMNNLAVYRKDGRLMERYDVVDVGRSAAGGEYQVQDGFGWTNAVLVMMMDELGIE